MRPHRLSSLHVVALGGCLLFGLAACGDGGGSSQVTPGDSGGGTTTTAPKATGTWTGSYTVTTGVARINAPTSSLGLVLPTVGQALWSSAAAATTRTVTFTIVFTQSGTTITGSYTDDAGRIGTVTGTLTAAGALTTTTAFVSGADGTLTLTGTVTTSATTSSISAASILENFVSGGTSFTGRADAILTGSGSNGTPGTVASPEDRFRGLWQSVDSGLNDQNHDGDGSLLSVSKNTDGTWAIGNALGQPRGVTAVTQSGVTLTFVVDDGISNGKHGWWRQVWTLAGQVVSAQAAFIADAASAPDVTASGWQVTGTQAWIRRELGDLPLLGTASLSWGDYDRTAVTPAGADISPLTVGYANDTITAQAFFAAPLDQGATYQVWLRAEQGGDNGDGEVRTQVTYRAGAWVGKIAGGAGAGGHVNWTTVTTPPAGCSVTIDALGVPASGTTSAVKPSIALRIPVATWQALTGDGSARPTLGWIRASSSAPGDVTTTADQTSAKYLRIPAAPVVPPGSFFGTWQRQDPGIMDRAYDNGEMILQIVDLGNGQVDLTDVMRNSFQLHPIVTGGKIVFSGDDGQNNGVQSWFKNVWTLAGDTINEVAYFATGPTMPALDSPAWTGGTNRIWTRRTTPIPTLGSTSISVTDTDAAATPVAANITAIFGVINANVVTISMQLGALPLDQTIGYSLDIAASESAGGEDGTVKVNVNWNGLAWAATAERVQTDGAGNQTRITLPGVSVTILSVNGAPGTSLSAVSGMRVSFNKATWASTLATLSTQGKTPTGGDAIGRTRTTSTGTDLDRSKRLFFALP